MASATDTLQTSDMAILSRLIRPESGILSVEAAQSLLAIQFSGPDLDLLQKLTEKNKDGTITPDESTALENYTRVGYLISLLHSKARRSLQLHQADR